MANVDDMFLGYEYRCLEEHCLNVGAKLAVIAGKEIYVLYKIDGSNYTFKWSLLEEPKLTARVLRRAFVGLIEFETRLPV